MAQMQTFDVVDAVTNMRASASAPLFAPLRFHVAFRVHSPVAAPALYAAVDFIADVASVQPPVCLMPFTPLAPPAFVKRSDTAAASPANTVTLSSSLALPCAPNELTDDGAAPLLSPGVVYELTFTVADLDQLRALPLKHLLQVGMMCLRLTTALPDSTTEKDWKAVDTDSLATWNVVWHVRRDPQNDRELVRTILSPLG